MLAREHRQETVESRLPREFRVERRRDDVPFPDRDNAPIAGIFYALELVIGGYAVTALIPVAVAGITGTLLERPALEQLRQDAKSDQYDRIYFHAADRITREAAHQTII